MAQRIYNPLTATVLKAQMQHLPNILTLLRILMIPGVYLAFFIARPLR